MIVTAVMVLEVGQQECGSKCDGLYGDNDTPSIFITEDVRVSAEVKISAVVAHFTDHLKTRGRHRHY